jgi:hypothetical protein
VEGSVRMMLLYLLARATPLYNENIIHIFYKARSLNEEVNYTELSTSDSIPCQYAPRHTVADPLEALNKTEMACQLQALEFISHLKECNDSLALII